MRCGWLRWGQWFARFGSTSTVVCSKSRCFLAGVAASCFSFFRSRSLSLSRATHAAVCNFVVVVRAFALCYSLGVYLFPGPASFDFLFTSGSRERSSYVAIILVHASTRFRSAPRVLHERHPVSHFTRPATLLFSLGPLTICTYPTAHTRSLGRSRTHAVGTSQIS